MADDNDDWLFDEDDEEFLAAWDEADRQAAAVLQDACATVFDSVAPAAELRAAAAALRTGLAERRWPYEYWVNACGWGDEVPDMDLVLWVGAVAATISPPMDPGTDIETQSAVMA